MLEAYAFISYHRGHHDAALMEFLHRDEHVARAQQQLRDLIRDLLTDGAETGDVRDDVAPEALASYCLHALAAACRPRLRFAGSSRSPWTGYVLALNVEATGREKRTDAAEHEGQRRLVVARIPGDAAGSGVKIRPAASARVSA